MTMLTLLTCAIVALLVYCLVLSSKLADVEGNLEDLCRIHDNFVDACSDAYEDLINQTNERIDDVNDIFEDIEDEFDEAQDVIEEVIDTIGLAVDTDKMIIDRLIKVEDESAYMRDVMEEHDDVLYSLFEDAPEEVEEEKPAKKKK